MSKPEIENYLLNQIHLKQLLTVITIDKHQSILRASEELSMTQPAVTKSLNKIESMLGASLFERTPKGVLATEYGQLFLKHSRAVMSELSDIACELQKLSSGQIGQVNIGVAVNLPLILAKTIAQFKAGHPEVGVKVQQGTNKDLVPLLRAGELDLILTQPYNLDEFSGIKNERLCRDQNSILVKRGHALALKKERLQPGDLLDYQWIIPPVDISSRNIFDYLPIEPPSSSLEISSPSVISDLLLRSDMVAVVLSKESFNYEINIGLLIALPFDFEFMHGLTYLTTFETRQLSPAAASFSELLKELALQHDALL